jgi:hypothetical protein
MDTSCFAYRSNRLTSDDTGTSTSWNQQNFRSTVTTPNLMRNTALNQRYSDHATTSLLLGFLNAWWNLVRLAVSTAYSSFAITHDYHRGETETTTAFHHCRTSLDFHDAIEHAVAEAFWLVCPLFA